MPTFCPSYLQLAIIEWQDCYFNSDSPEIILGSAYPWGEESKVKFEIEKCETDRTDYFGNYCTAWFLSFCLDDTDWSVYGDFPKLSAAKEFAEFILWQLRKGNGLASVPCDIKE
jgi:hypothetical protein